MIYFLQENYSFEVFLATKLEHYFNKEIDCDLPYLFIE